jgi:hypothetical protein
MAELYRCSPISLHGVMLSHIVGYRSRGAGLGFWSPDRMCGPPNLLSNWYRGSFPRIKQPEVAADH